jgi:hypothetical protein
VAAPCAVVTIGAADVALESPTVAIKSAGECLVLFSYTAPPRAYTYTDFTPALRGVYVTNVIKIFY